VKPAPSALALLLREPQRFRFDAAVRVLMHAGRTSDPAAAARYRSVPGLGFLAADVTAASPAEGGRAPVLTTAVIGLTGAAGVLPRYYTEVLNQTLRNKSRSLHDFLDLLSHRVVAQFAGAAVKYRLNRATETARLTPSPPSDDALPNDPMALALLAFTGHATGALRGRIAAGTDPLLHYAGLLSMRPRSADRLASLVSDWLGRPVEVVQFAGAWLHLAPDQRSRLPMGRRPGAWNRLGTDAAIGVRAWDLQARVVLRVGPLNHGAFAALLPDRAGLRQLVSLVRVFLGLETGFAINPVLAADAIPVLVLSPEPDRAPRLGWNCWLPSAGRRTSDGGEPIFEADLVEAQPMLETTAQPMPETMAR
jgi:type VI secretion system protein ImpH